ncbi:unnamed protein product [Effrenium voratum]|nr:unnamed protein product [Effrenium voratum]
MTIIDFLPRCLGPLPDGAAEYCSEYMSATGIKEFYNCKYDPKNPEFWKQIELPNGADETYVCIGVKASNYFMPKCTLSDKGPGGGGWIHFNKYLQVTKKPSEGGGVWADGSIFAVGDCNYGCIGEPGNWEMPPVPKISYPGEEQAYHACLNVIKLSKNNQNLTKTWWPWGAGMFATSLGPHDACFVAGANENKNSGYMVNWWIPAALQKEIIETSKIDECRDRWVGILIWHFVHHTPVHLFGRGEGQYTRFRRVIAQAKHGGRPCDGVTHQTETCESRACQVSDCQVSEWAEWSTTNPLGEANYGQHSQWFRARRILVPPGAGGRPCPGSLTETRPYDREAPMQCVLSAWSLWSRCDRTCGGGQRMRERSLQEASHALGSCGHHLLKMVAPCGSGACYPSGNVDCQMSMWDEWSPCTARCGAGSKTRERRVISEALAGGHSCEGPLKMMESCQVGQCNIVDCRWGEWASWSDCSCECGGGTKRRTRAVMEAPRNGGASCQPQAMEEAFPCNTQPCGQGCVDGQWGAWGSWTECSATCASSYRSRSRNLDIQPSACGKAAGGPRDQFELCTDLPPCVQDTDCELHDWGQWSHCSCHCFGIRERNRYISHFATGNGKACKLAALKVIEPCNPGPIVPFNPDAPSGRRLLPAFNKLQAPPLDCQEKPPVNCELHLWDEWTRCSRDCGGGQRERSRTVKTAPKHGGQPCETDLTTVEPCNEQPCHQIHCEDCMWGAWSTWGACSKCGGQKYRHRSIAQMANHCGKPCEMKASKETTSCTSECAEPLYCAWTEWSGATSCASCGPATTMRNRALGFTSQNPGPGNWFFRVQGESECAGTQLNVSLCPSAGESCESCVPQHCHFGSWGEWREPTCVGLCERERTIAVTNNECGDPCSGPLLMTKSCPVECSEPKDCEFSAWTQWSECPLFQSQSQRTRSRTIAQQPENQGSPCVGPLEETIACEYNHMKVDCKLTHWSPWSSCSRTCGLGGWKERTRNVADPAQAGGLQCEGGLTELVGCHDGPEICPGFESMDCKFAPWAPWSAPDLDNARKRVRKISQMAVHGGRACSGPLEEVESIPPITTDCEVSEWTMWDSCDRSRNRYITSLRSADGQGCELGLGMTQKCDGDHFCGKTDCRWGEWSQWSGCTCSCGGGQQTRTRHIARAPRNGGLPCEEGDKEQLAPCNVQECGTTQCRDGQWGEWTEWSPCSVSCGGGVTFRRRRVDIMANECGKEPLGKSKEIQFCDVGVSCSRWGTWSACSGSCDGIRHRSRVVRVYGRGDGRYCMGGLRETAPCSPSQSEPLPQGCGPGRPQDCLFSQWEGWATCSASCGGGEHTRSRSIAREAKNNGLPCIGALSEISECARHECGGPAPKDCIFGEWEEWGACGKCSGQRHRFRSIVQYPTAGGKECELTNTEQAGKCPRSCHAKQFCGWASWEMWGECSASCGTGYRQRRRQLMLSENQHSVLLGTDMIQEYDSLMQRAEELDAKHFRELVMAFAAGGACLMAIFGTFRGWSQGAARTDGSASSRTISRAGGNAPADTSNGEYFLVADEHETELPWAPRHMEHMEMEDLS